MRWGIAAVIPEKVYFYDIDQKIHDMDIQRVVRDTVLLYQTGRGYHAFSFNESSLLKYYIDKNCPCDAVRIYPDDDFRLIHKTEHPNTFINYLNWIHGWISPEGLNYFSPRESEPLLKTYCRPRAGLFD